MIIKSFFNILVKSKFIKWGLGIGDWAQSPIPNPQSPIPNPHYLKELILNLNDLLLINNN